MLPVLTKQKIQKQTTLIKLHRKLQKKKDTPVETPAVTQTTVTYPVISPSGGDYSEGFKEITITCNTEGVNIFYTTNGKDPTTSDDRYTGPFRIIGSKTVKAIAVKDKTSSGISTASYNLNAGKSQSQLGVISGTIRLDETLSEEVKSELAEDTVYIYSDEIPGVVKSCKVGQTYYFDGLDTTKAYSFYFTNEKPDVIQGSVSRAISTGQQTVKGKNGKSSVAKKIDDVLPAEGFGLALDVDLSATGTVKGVAKRFDITGKEETDHAGTVIFVPGTSYSVYTDKNGNFALSGLPQGYHTIRAQYAGYSFAEKEKVLLKATSNAAPETVIDDQFEVVYGKGILTGTVLLSDALDTASLTGINIVITKGELSYTAATSSNGSFSIVDIIPGAYTVEISKDGYQRATVTNVNIIGATVTYLDTTTLQVIGGSLSGSVTIPGKTDLSGISILAESAEGKSYFAITNQFGEFSWERVSPGKYTISASYAGYKTSSVTNVSVTIGGEVSGVIIPAMEKSTYSITGKIFLEGMDTFEGTAVLVQNTATLKSVANTVTGKDGTFTVSDIEPGEYLLTVSRDGYITSNSVTVSVGISPIASAGQITLENALGSVKGNVTMESAADHAGITVLVQSTETASKNYSTVTDSTGHFSIGGVTPGIYKVQATKSGYNNGYSDAFTVSAGSVIEVSDIGLAIAQRSIYGNIALEGRTDFAGVKVTATNVEKPTMIYSALSNSQGLYALSGMVPGEYILSYSFEGYVTYTGSSVSLESDSSKEVSKVTLNKARGKISGIANLEGKTDHSGITVSLVGTDFTTETDSDGAYEFSVPSGNYPGGLRFSKEDFQLTAKADTIPVLTDSTYGVLSVELKATANTVKGVIDLAGTDDDSGITVTIDEYSSFKVVTKTDGKWQFDHVPLSGNDKYLTVRFTKLNTPDVTSKVKVIAADIIDVGSLQMIPNAATLKGHAYLKDMTDHQNIVVTVKTDGKDDLVTRTTSDGLFEVTNILATGSHEIVFSKSGWNSKTITIDDFEPLEERNLASDITLTDTTKPDFTSVVINDGVNFTNSTQLNILINATDTGSGIDKMTVQIKASGRAALYPEEPVWESYKVQFTKDLSELPSQIFSGNGEYGVYITLKDKAGNTTASKYDMVSITEQVAVLKGVLTGDDLHLTKEKSPYRVEGKCLVEDGNTLVIDPGVQIEFAGNYFLKINGEINAVGTETEKIIFTKSEDCEEIVYDYCEGTNYWNGIDIGSDSLSTEEGTDYRRTYISGNIVKNCVFEYAYRPLNDGKIYCQNVIFRNNLLGPSTAGCFFDNTFDDCEYKIDGTIFNNTFKKAGSISGTVINNIIIELGEGRIRFGGKVENNDIIKGNIFSDSNVLFRYNKFVEVTMGITRNVSFINNNFMDCSGTFAEISDRYSDVPIINMTANYWGPAATEELKLVGTSANLTFIYDYYDYFELARIDCSKYHTQPVENAGYLGDSYTNDIHESKEHTLGDIIMSDGTYLTPAQYSVYAGTAKAIAVYAGTNIYGKALGLGIHSASELVWAPSDTTGYNKKFGDICADSENTGDLDGSDNWDYICSVDKTGTLTPETNYPAFNYALTYGQNEELTGTEYESGWFIPSIYELQQLYYNRAILDESLYLVGGSTFDYSNWSRYYWSSSQDSYYNSVWCLRFFNGNVNSDYKGYSSYVRVLRTFN